MNINMTRAQIRSTTYRTIDRLARDIRFWIILLFILRLYGIWLPPLETVHNWRQTTVAMVARNFLETDPNILYPRVDFAGDKTGITGMEFPLLNYLIYLVSFVFGYQHWYGRLINLAVSSMGIYYFYLLVKKYFHWDIAFYSAFVLLFSLWFSYSRKIMPDTFSLSLMIMGLYYGTNYLESKNKFKPLILYFIFTLFAILSKLPSGYLLVIFIPFVFNKSTGQIPKIIFSGTTAVLVAAVSAYYFYWVPYLVEEYGFWHFYMGKSMQEGFYELILLIDRTLVNFYEEALKYFGFLMFLFGLFMAFRRKNKTLVIVFLLSFAGFLMVMLKAGSAFSNHAYYILPFVPVMALVAGYGISRVKSRKLVLIILLAIALEGLLNQKQDFFIHSDNMAIYGLEEDLDAVSERTDLILINSGNYPTPMYFAHRKGWITFNENIADSAYISDLQEKGLKYIVILKKTFGTELILDYTTVFQNEDYTIYRTFKGK